MLDYFPKYFTNKAIILYLAILILVNVVFFANLLSPVWWIFGLVEVVTFFYFSNRLTRKWSVYSERLFSKKLFVSSLVIRLVWVVFSYFFYQAMTGQPFEFSSADALNYHNRAEWIVGLVQNRYFQPYYDFVGEGYADAGYPTYLSVIYFLTGNSIIIARIIKALIGAYTAVLVYKLAGRGFGDQVGRMAGIFMMLMPNMILYCGLHLKEVEMVFLTVAFVERADFVIRSKKLSFINLLLPLLLAGAMFMFRTVLGATALFAFLTALMLSSNELVGWGRRMMLTGWVVLVIAYLAGGRIATEIEEVWEARKVTQTSSLQWRAEREGGNKFSTSASAAVFAPLIFVIPFPTMVSTPGQENQQLINGGNYDKNILAFFVLFALLLAIRSGKWREYVLIGTFLIGYLVIMAMSSFAQSERFHQPAMPFLLIFAAYGVSEVTNKTKKYFTWYMVFIFVAILGWSWFKLAGRGMA
jgi:4-amino-4-deoxy-L-arabinose transferase-like glycosyltransferase